MTTLPVVGFVGMTHLGLCSAVAAASKGGDVYAFDPDAAHISRLDSGNLPVLEPSLDDLLRDHRHRIHFTAKVSDLSRCDLVYVAPDVPTDDHGESDLTSVDELLGLIVAQLPLTALIVVLSQVPPGFTRAHQQPDRVVYYQVETLAFGLAMERATRPERIIVGVPDPKQPLPDALARFLTSFDCPILPMGFESAELTKISINCCLVASISVANTLAELCENIGADWSEIAPALRLDRRIGKHSYLAPGLGISGGNLERDLATVMRFSEAHGTEAGVIRAFITNSRYRRDWVLRVLHDQLLDQSPASSIGILGLAYKENTRSTKNSPSLALIEHLGPWKLRAYDPAISQVALPHANVTMTKSALDVAEGVDALVIMTPWPIFRTLSCSNLGQRMRGRLVIDPYRVLDSLVARQAGLTYLTLGAI